MGFGKLFHLYSPGEDVRGKLWLPEGCTGSKWQNGAFALSMNHNRIYISLVFTLCKLPSCVLAHITFITILQTEWHK